LKEIIVSGDLSAEDTFSLVKDLWGDPNPDVRGNVVQAIDISNGSKPVLALLKEVR